MKSQVMKQSEEDGDEEGELWDRIEHARWEVNEPKLEQISGKRHALLELISDYMVCSNTRNEMFTLDEDDDEEEDEEKGEGRDGTNVRFMSSAALGKQDVKIMKRQVMKQSEDRKEG
ncbi:hypothetical protein Ancab_032636 [Ancistrocladus abbreviatus]